MKETVEDEAGRGGYQEMRGTKGKWHFWGQVTRVMESQQEPTGGAEVSGGEMWPRESAAVVSRLWGTGARIQGHRGDKRSQKGPAVRARVLSRFGHVWPFVTHQAPPSMEFPRQEYWSGLSYPPPGHLPDPGIVPSSLMTPALAGGSFYH